MIKHNNINFHKHLNLVGGDASVEICYASFRSHAPYVQFVADIKVPLSWKSILSEDK